MITVIIIAVITAYNGPQPLAVSREFRKSLVSFFICFFFLVQLRVNQTELTRLYFYLDRVYRGEEEKDERGGETGRRRRFTRRVLGETDALFTHGHRWMLGSGPARRRCCPWPSSECYRPWPLRSPRCCPRSCCWR